MDQTSTHFPKVRPTRELTVFQASIAEYKMFAAITPSGFQLQFVKYNHDHLEISVVKGIALSAALDSISKDDPLSQKLTNILKAKTMTILTSRFTGDTIGKTLGIPFITSYSDVTGISLRSDREDLDNLLKRLPELYTSASTLDLIGQDSANTTKFPGILINSNVLKAGELSGFTLSRIPESGDFCLAALSNVHGISLANVANLRAALFGDQQKTFRTTVVADGYIKLEGQCVKVNVRNYWQIATIDLQERIEILKPYLFSSGANVLDIYLRTRL